MYIEQLEVKGYKILENIKMDFLLPQQPENAVNVIAGINGSGKTTILEIFYQTFTSQIEFKEAYGEIQVTDRTIQISGFLDNPSSVLEVGMPLYNTKDLSKHFSNLNKYIDGVHSSPRVIYIPITDESSYEAKSTLDRKYNFVTLIHSNELLGNAELYIKDFVISRERQSKQSDPKKRTKEAVKAFNDHFKENKLITELIGLDEFDNQKPLFQSMNGNHVTIDQLSTGEKQLYGRVIGLMILNPHNSIILIDEPELGMHPQWQRKILDIYKKIGKGNQFIITTHSPHIISESSYKELIILYREENTIRVKQFEEPPVSPDINAILGEIMQTKVIPDELENLHRQYREYVEKGEHASPEALAVKGKILEFETEHSEFMQNIKFYLELNL